MNEVTVGIDIGTSSVKAVAADGEGNVVARSRVAHPVRVPTPQRFEHDATVAWRDGPRRALDALGDIAPKGLSVAAMVPSLTTVDEDGVPVAPGLLYGDERGHREGGDAGIAEAGELMAFLRWHTRERPEAHGYWMAQAVANHALCGRPVVSNLVAMTAHPLFDFTKWDEARLADCGARPEQMPEIGPATQPLGEVIGRPGCVLEGGTIDALGEQLVAGAEEPGDVLVILGTTLITWCVAEAAEPAEGYYAIPHTAAGRRLVGGPSNAGGLFLDWANRLVGGGERDAPDALPDDPGRVPVWAPYPRGERVPIQDPTRRARLVDLDLTHDATAVRRAAFEASGFVARRIIEAAPDPARRIVATGGGTRVDGWLRALADATGLPVHVCAVPEGGALGAAFLGRCAAGLETDMTAARRWARTDRIIEPDPAWASAVAERYGRFREVAG